MSNQATLFGASQIDENPNTCRSCEFRERHQCGGRVIQYCGIRKSSRTDNGKLKIKCTMSACSLFKKESK